MKRRIATLLAFSTTLFASALGVQGGILLFEEFAYPDGSLTNVSHGKWTLHSGNGAGVAVSGGAVTLDATSGALTDDVHSPLADGPISATSGTVLYGSLTLKVSALPVGPGGYFAHFKDGSTGFRCRLFATTTDAAIPAYRLGIANAAAAASAVFPADLNPDTTYTVVFRYDVTAATSTVWVNPASEADAGADATDGSTPIDISALALRQSFSSSANAGWLAIDNVVIGTSFHEVLSPGAVAPLIAVQPQSQSVATGATVVLRVIASGSAPLSFQWLRQGAELAGATEPELMIVNASTAAAGDYRVKISNAVGESLSDTATLTVQDQPGPIVTDIAYLHTLLDLTDYMPTDTTNLFTVEGVVTTHTNITVAPDVLFYLQDATAGIAVFWRGGTNQFVPKAGDKVRVTAPLTHFRGLLEFAPDRSKPATSVTLLSTGHPLPAPLPLEFNWQNDPAVIEPYEGRYVVASNVFLDLGTPTFATGGVNVTMTNALGETFVLRVDARTDIGGQVKPAGAITVLGVLGQFDTSRPYTAGYQLLATRFADLISVVKAPTVRFTNRLENLVRPGDPPTNTFTEHALRPGERLTMPVLVTDPEGRDVTIAPGAEGLPASARWTLGATTGKELTATFTMQPTAADAGRQYDITLRAWNQVATNTAVWVVYVPTTAEQQVIITEYLANPTSDANAPFFNPLRRDDPSLNPSTEDEYVELANLSAEDLDLVGWMIFDSNSLAPRFKFYETAMLISSNALIAYGGPLVGYLPNLDVPAVMSQESSVGLALNNTGDSIMLRNASSNLVARVVYTAAMVSNEGSMTRYPDANGAFVAQASVSTNLVTPGRQWDGQPFNVPAGGPAEVGQAAITPGAPGTIRLTWQAAPGRTYTVWSASKVTGPYTPRVSGLTAGQYTDNALAGVPQRFYRVSSP